MATFEEYVKDKFRHEVYNVLADLSNKYADVPVELQKQAMEEAMEWFMIKFYEEDQE